MCLKYNKELTEEYKLTTEQFIAYKMVRVKNFIVESPYRYVTLGPGKNVAHNRDSQRMTEEEYITGEIDHGCHLFVTREDAITNTAYYLRAVGVHIIEVLVKPEHIIAAGYFEISGSNQVKSIVCTEYFISQKEYNKLGVEVCV